MEILFALFLLVLLIITIRGFIKTKDDERLYRSRIEKMSEGELRHELYNLNLQVKHMPNRVRMNSSNGILLRKNKIKAKAIQQELQRR